MRREMTLVDHEPLLSTQETARLLNVSQATVRKLARSGDLPSLRVGRQLRFDAGAIVKPQQLHTARGHANRTNGRNSL